MDDDIILQDTLGWRRVGEAQHRLCIASYAQLVTFEAIEPLFPFIEHLHSKRDGQYPFKPE